MQLFLTDRRTSFPRLLNGLKSVRVMPYERSQLTEKTTVFRLKGIAFETVDTDFLFAYRIFPEHILSALPQWQQEHRPMQVGDTVVQQAFLPPWKPFSVKAVFGVRISGIIDAPGRVGFSYETLEGHVERGVSTFLLEAEDDGVVFSIHTFSQPGNVLTRLFGRLFTVPYQAFCTKAAGENVLRQLRDQHAARR